MNNPTNNRARQHLERLQLQFPVDRELGSEPVFLDRGIDNSLAFAHTVRLSSYDYPLAYGDGYKKHKVKQDIKLFRHYDASTAVIGEGRRILGGVVITRHIALGWDLDPTDDDATIGYLFRLRGVKPAGIEHVGKTLLSFALECINNTSATGVRSGVVANNIPAVDLFNLAGFESESAGYTAEGSHKLLAVGLDGKESITKAHDILKAQL
jgi:hypothetical protein